MTTILQVFPLLTIAFFLNNISAFRKGLITGFFISLYFLGIFNPLLSIIPIGVSLFLFISSPKETIKDSVRLPGPRKSIIFMIVFFIISMAIFFAYNDILTSYGSFINIEASIINKAAELSKVAYILGPIFIGSLCDRKGSFYSVIVLALLSEVALWCVSRGETSDFIYYAASFLIHFASGGFFVLLPRLIETFFGKALFPFMYSSGALLTGTTFFIAKTFYEKNLSYYANPGDFLIALLLLLIIATFFIYLAWQRRFKIVVDKGNLGKNPEKSIRH